MTHKPSLLSRIKQYFKQKLDSPAAQGAKDFLSWYVPFGICNNYKNINTSDLSQTIRIENDVYGHVEGLEENINLLERKKNEQGKGYELLRDAGLTSTGVLIYAGVSSLANNHADDNIFAYMGAAALGYLIGSLLAIISYKNFVNNATQDLTYIINSHKKKQEDKEDDDEEDEPSYSQQTFTPQEIEYKEQETNPKKTTKQRSYDEKKPSVIGQLVYDFETFYTQYCAEFQPKKDEGQQNSS